MSFANLFASSLQTLANIHGKDDGTLHSTLSFFGGIVLILLIDKLIPHYENPHEMHRVEEMSLKEERKTEIKPQLLRVDVGQPWCWQYTISRKVWLRFLQH